MAVLDLNCFEEGNNVIHSGTDGKDWIALRLESICNDIKDLIIKGHEDPDDSVFKPYYKKIEEALEKRFGMEYNLVYNSGMLYATELTGPSVESGIYGCRDWFKSMSNPVDAIKTLSGLHASDPQYQKAVRLNRVLEESGLEIDVEKAFVKNWPKGIKVDLYWDVVFTISFYHVGNTYTGSIGVLKNIAGNRGAFPISVIVAPVLHEVGHVFTGLTSLYQTRKNRIALEDIVRDQQKKGKSNKEAFIYGFKQVYGNKSPECAAAAKSGNITRIQVELIRTELSKYSFNKSVSSGTDGEFQADQFATRLGVGKDLAIFLDSFHAKRFVMMVDITLATTQIILLFVFLFSGFNILAVGLTLLSIIKICLVYCILNTLFIKLAGFTAQLTGDANGLMSYDADRRRIERIRLDLIRQLRTSNTLTPETRKKYLGYIDLVGTMLEGYTGLMSYITNSRGVLKSSFISVPLLRYFLDKTFDSGAVDELDRLIEENMENDLHVSYNRFS